MNCETKAFPRGLHKPPDGSIEFANKYLWNYDTPHSPPRTKSRRHRLFDMIKPIKTKGHEQCSHAPPSLPFVSPPNSPLSRERNIAPLGIDEFDYHSTVYGVSSVGCLQKVLEFLKLVATSVMNFLQSIYINLNKPSRLKWILSFCIFVVVMILIDFTHQPINHEKAFALQIMDSGLSDFEALNNPASAQFQALKWIANDQSDISTPDFHFFVRYGLAVFYYSVKTYKGSVPWDKSTWLTEKSVCDWHGVICHHDFDYLPQSEVVGLNLTNVMGQLPKELSVLQHLKWINLDNGNALSGTLPSQICMLANLMVLSLGNNNFAGTIPSEIASMTSLELLGLQNNSLNSTIPNDIGNLSNLVALYLDGNKLTGQIPNSISALSNILVDFRLNENKINGTIPTGIGTLTRLQKLHLQANQLSGTIPNQMKKLSRLRYINLKENRIVGVFPESVCHVVSHQHFGQVHVDCDSILCSCCECSNESSGPMRNNTTSISLFDGHK